MLWDFVLFVGVVKGELNVVLFNRVCQNAHSSEYWTCQLTDCGYFQLRCDFCFWFRLHYINISCFNLLLKKIYQRRLIVFCIYSVSFQGNLQLQLIKTYIMQFFMEGRTKNKKTQKPKMYFSTVLKQREIRAAQLPLPSPSPAPPIPQSFLSQFHGLWNQILIF